MKEYQRKKHAGFSLIELLVAISMLAILIGIVAPMFAKYVGQSRRATDVDEAKEIAKSVERVLVSEASEKNEQTSSFRLNNDSKMPSAIADNKTVEDYVLLDLGTVPKSKTYKKYEWKVQYQPQDAHVEKVLLTNKQTNQTHEVYPQAEQFLNQP